MFGKDYKKIFNVFKNSFWITFMVSKKPRKVIQAFLFLKLYVYLAMHTYAH